LQLIVLDDARVTGAVSRLEQLPCGGKADILPPLRGFGSAIRETEMPSCPIRGVRSVELTTANLEEAARFYETVWNLAPVETRNTSRYFRGTAGHHHLLGLHTGAQPAVVRIVFDIADRKAIDTLHRMIAAAGRKPNAPGPVSIAGGGYGFGCKDPDGRNLVFVCEAVRHGDTADKPDRPRKIVHVNLNARDFDASLKFFTATLGFRLVDDSGPLWFLHCDNTDHSSIVLAKTDLPTLNHIAFEMPEFDSVMRGMGRMKENGYPIEWGPGRHGAGDNVFAYFCGPDELPIEYAAEVLQIDDSYEPHSSSYWKFAPGRSDQWGITQPRSARYYRVQRLFGFTPDGDRVS
jgi:catechol 2,3-dioxygenase-like lactoylglutathione lyase family enzyme